VWRLQRSSSKPSKEEAMTGRYLEVEMMNGENGAYDDLLSPCETHEGSRHYAACIANDQDVVSTKKTVVMSPALLAQLRTVVKKQASREPLETRPTLRSMAAARPESYS
jgi:hypothetical protein